MNALPQGYSMQPIPLDDVPCLARFINAYARRGFTDAEGLRDVERARPLLHVGRSRFAGPSGEPIEPTLDEGS